MASLNKQFFSHIGTGATITFSGERVGFTPKKVVVRNRSRDMLEWFEGMADGYAYKTVAAGTRTLITSLGITPLAGGFTLGADTDVNVSGEIIDIEVEG